MNIRFLQIFEAVCETGSATAAAGRLRLTQPAVTHALKRLEAESGLVLFERLSKRLHLTECGRAYREKAVRILEMCRELESGTESIERRLPLRLGSCITIACFWLPRILASYLEKSSGFPPVVRVASAGAIMGMLEANDIDLALYEGTAPNRPYISFPFSRYRLVPVCRVDHPFAGRDKIAVTALLAENLLLREEGSAIRDVFDGFLRSRQLAVQPVMTSVNSQALLRGVEAGLGVSILPEVLVEGALRDGKLAAFRVAGMRLENENRVVFHRDKRQTEGMRRFLACMNLGDGRDES